MFWMLDIVYPLLPFPLCFPNTVYMDQEVLDILLNTTFLMIYNSSCIVLTVDDT